MSNNWIVWSSIIPLANASASRDCDGAQGCFKSDNKSFYLRQSDDQWIVDEVDDRGQHRNDTARFSTLELAEKYLIWNWASVARSAVGAEPLRPELYAAGFSRDISVLQLKEGIYKLTSPLGEAVLIGVSATIFSHLMTRSVDQIVDLVKEGIAWPSQK